jgi:hypothetical protein
MKPLFYTQHAQDAVDERQIDPAWIERTVRSPEWKAPDPRRVGVERRFSTIPEYGDRVLRVACYETVLEIRILTVFFDRDARRP